MRNRKGGRGWALYDSMLDADEKDRERGTMLSPAVI